MGQETMNSSERFAQALRLEKPDRVPVAPAISDAGVASLAGYTQAQLAADLDLSRTALFKVFDDFGGWDAMQLGFHDATLGKIAVPMESRIPGVDLPDDYTPQFIEKEVLRLEDYDTISEIGWDRFFFEQLFGRLHKETPEEVAAMLEAFMAYFAQSLEEAAQRGVEPFGGSPGTHPFFNLSMGRSLLKFTEDLYYHQDAVERALKRMTEDIITTSLATIKQIGIKRMLIAEERASATIYPPAITERFWWPYTQAIVDAMWSEGIPTIFHLDTNWDKNLPDFPRKLPRGSYCLQLDSTSDIFAAKEVLRGHGALMGDVPASLFAIGEPEDMRAYVKRLIDEVGDDGGFVLSAGCSMPANTKPENFRAFLETGKTYELSK